MSGIAKLENKVKVEGSATPYGGDVVDLQYSISYEGTSSLSITVANSSGEYDEPELNSSSPVRIEFGDYTLRMLPVSFKKSKGGSKGRTMSVTFEDMSLKYLDKTVVLLKNQHLTVPAPCTIVLGQNFAPNEKGVSQRYFGGWKPEGMSVLYDIRDLAVAIDEHEIPISDGFYQYLKQFTAYEGDTDDPAEDCGIRAFLRDDSGVLRNVISTVCGELGVIPFWNNEDGMGSLGNRAKPIIKNKDAKGSGFLDFINLEDDIDKENIEDTVSKLSDSCNVEDDSYEVSIKNSFMKGGIGAFSVEPSQVLGGSSLFKRIRFQEDVYSPHTENSVDIEGNYELNLLMRAAVAGPEFYKKYVIQKLIASYAKDLKDSTFEALKSRDQNEDPLPETFDFVDKPVKDEGGKIYPFDIIVNEVVDKLYKGADFDFTPIGYSTNFNWHAWDKKGKLGVAGQINLDVKGDSAAIDSKYYQILGNPSFMEELGLNSEFIAVEAKVTAALTTFLENTDEDPIYQDLIFLAEHYGRYWYGGLITGKSFSARVYAGDVRTYFSDLAVTETELASVYKRYKSSDTPVSDDRLWDTGTYYLNWGGTAECGYKVLPDNTVTLPDRNLEVKDAYQHIISIRTFVGSGPNAAPEITDCNDGRRERALPSLRKTESGEEGLFRFETYQIRTDKDLELEETCIAGANQTCLLVGESRIFGLGNSITSAQYAEVNRRRTDCNRPDNIARTKTSKCSPSAKDVVFSLPTDNDFMSQIHVTDQETRMVDPDLEMSFAAFEAKTEALTDVDSWWNNSSQLLAVESKEIEVEEGVKTSWGERNVDYWDAELMREVVPAADIQRVFNLKSLKFTYIFEELLQGLRCAYIPVADLDKVTKIQIDNIPFDIGQLLSAVPFIFEYAVCDDKGYIDLPEAERNLVDIMKNYIDANTSPSISRDFVISGFGFKDSLDGDPRLPSVYEGLESMSIVFNANGIHTSVKIGNKRRARFSSEMRNQLIVKGLAGTPSSYRIPNNVTHSFALSLRTKM